MGLPGVWVASVMMGGGKGILSQSVHRSGSYLLQCPLPDGASDQRLNNLLFLLKAGISSGTRDVMTGPSAATGSSV